MLPKGKDPTFQSAVVHRFFSLNQKFHAKGSGHPESAQAGNSWQGYPTA
jgi:hypothetical protein